MKVEINGVEYVPKSIAGTSNAMPFGDLIAQARKASNMTLEQVAQGVGTSKSHIHTLEQGRSVPRLPMLDSLLRFYGLSYYRIKTAEQEQEVEA